MGNAFFSCCDPWRLGEHGEAREHDRDSESPGIVAKKESMPASSCASVAVRRLPGVDVALLSTAMIAFPSEPLASRVESAVRAAATMDGVGGLRAAGFEFRFIPCEGCSSDVCNSITVKSACRSTTVAASDRKVNSDGAVGRNPQEPATVGKRRVHSLTCSSCATRLFDIESGALVTEANRHKHVADGAMFDAVSILCQQTVQDEILRKEYGMRWVKTFDISGNKKRVAADKCSIRALVTKSRESASTGRLLLPSGWAENKERDNTSRKKGSGHAEVHPQNWESTLLVLPGRGGSHAGIFSRRHLMTSGVEVSTAVPMVREALTRGMDVVMLDPNSRGEALFNDTFERSLTFLFESKFGRGGLCANPELARDEAASHIPQPLYILSHSASGGVLVRCLLDDDTPPTIPKQQRDQLLLRTRAIAFTDSTHNIQWARRREQRGRANDKRLSALLESPSCIYIRSNNVRSVDMNASSSDRDRRRKLCGMAAETDEWWIHRFGSIRTVWAGTDSHALVNWYAHNLIWDHFDAQHQLFQV
uniref:Uncharacterized protein n=1 Tax=Odontella aurita TaxID=265563 RepID=A0A7S4JLB9_9STRA|mmetsp:Transcript_48644/g.146645  ORF Transcript_48644/g.146645 Transcript_48644/m.146645 type:complete len:535 (+) Transcript_48644:73-1677(+)